MSRYLLQCSCGKKHLVESGQAGQTIDCTCGSILEVPTMRRLATLERADDATPARTSSASAWGSRQGMLLGGLLLAVVGLAAALYLYVTRPTPQDYSSNREGILAMPAQPAWQLWQMLESNGIELPRTSEEQRIQSMIQERTGWTWVAGIVAVMGVAIAAAGLLLRPNPLGSG